MRQLNQAIRPIRNLRGRARATLAPVLAIAAVASCGEVAPPPPPPPPTVVVAQPVRRTVTLYEYATGTTRATESVEVKARVSGELREMHFEPSHTVKKGDLLFVIEPERYKAARDEAFAAVKSAEADLARAESDLKRAKEAAESKAIAAADLDLAQAKKSMADAGVLSAKAALENAELEYSYTRVVAPISGQVGRNMVDVGNIVNGSQETLLTTINKLKPIFVYFNAPEKVVLRALERMSRTVGDPVSEDDPVRERQQVYVATLTDQGFPHEGTIDFVSNTVDSLTGTIELRAVIPNEDILLFPGLFVRIRMPVGMLENAVLVDERAIGTDLGGKYVYTVGGDGLVEQRYVELGTVEADHMVPVLEGLDGTETYIVEGLLRARPGMPVTPTTAEAADSGEKN